jgi:16S rRNA (uracil1498-N3)-methyltransferase
MLFYAPDIASNPYLPEKEAHHCLKVLRMKQGDMLKITDGVGNFYQAEISEIQSNRCKVNLIETIPQPPLWPGSIEIALAPTKNSDRIEWFVEKATEIGIDKISFLGCRFSERKEMSTERIRKIMISAMKQSEKAQLPVLQEMTDFTAFIRKDFNGQKFIFMKEHFPFYKRAFIGVPSTICVYYKLLLVNRRRLAVCIRVKWIEL